MGIDVRTDLSFFPGAITEVKEPFTCTLQPSIQALAKALMEGASASTILNGRILTEATTGEITTICEV